MSDIKDSVENPSYHVVLFIISLIDLGFCAVIISSLNGILMVNENVLSLIERH